MKIFQIDFLFAHHKMFLHLAEFDNAQIEILFGVNFRLQVDFQQNTLEYWRTSQKRTYSLATCWSFHWPLSVKHVILETHMKFLPLACSGFKMIQNILDFRCFFCRKHLKPEQNIPGFQSPIIFIFYPTKSFTFCQIP